MLPGKRATTEAKFEGPVWEWDTFISCCPLSGPKWPRPIFSACDVHFAQLILKAQPTASCKCVSIGTRTRGGVMAMDCTGVQLKLKGLGTLGVTRKEVAVFYSFQASVRAALVPL